MVRNKDNLFLLAMGIIFASLVSRAPITGVGSVIELIKDDLSISNSVAGFITTIPLLIFATFSPFISKISYKTGMARAIVYGVLLILVGTLLRSYVGSFGVFAGTAVIGMGIVFINVLIPAIIKLKFAEKIGLMTGVYTTFMGVASSIAAGFSVPMAVDFGMGWQNTLAVWGAVALCVIIVWLPYFRNGKKWGTEKAQVENKQQNIFKSSLAWAVAFFMGLQSILFYAFVAWLPTIVVFKGYQLETAGYFALLYQLVCIPFSFIVPIFCDKYKDQRVLTFVIALLYLIGMILFLIAKGTVLLSLAIFLCGVGSGAAISLAMTFMALRSVDSVQASKLSGMAQSIGYFLAAPATTIMGYLFDVTHTWNIPILFLILINVLWLIAGTRAAADRKLFVK